MKKTCKDRIMQEQLWERTGWIGKHIEEIKSHNEFWKAHVKLDLAEYKCSKTKLLIRYAKEIDELKKLVNHMAVQEAE